MNMQKSIFIKIEQHWHMASLYVQIRAPKKPDSQETEMESILS